VPLPESNPPGLVPGPRWPSHGKPPAPCAAAGDAGADGLWDGKGIYGQHISAGTGVAWAEGGRTGVLKTGVACQGHLARTLPGKRCRALPASLSPPCRSSHPAAPQGHAEHERCSPSRSPQMHKARLPKTPAAWTGQAQSCQEHLRTPPRSSSPGSGKGLLRVENSSSIGRRFTSRPRSSPPCLRIHPARGPAAGTPAGCAGLLPGIYG